MDELIEESEEFMKSVFIELDSIYKNIEPIIGDPIHRGELSGIISMEKYDKFEYFGDRHLIMDDYWSQLTPENRLVLLGHTMNMSTIHFFYGKYGAMFNAMADIIRQHETFKKEDELEYTLPTTKPSYLG